ncbi:hypothetical protein M758_UG146600 [Ceratodon purpureus]|nr:hypothetical protein M758_UG146600 [Ceratodon purpureus]
MVGLKKSNDTIPERTCGASLHSLVGLKESNDTIQSNVCPGGASQCRPSSSSMQDQLRKQNLRTGVNLCSIQPQLRSIISKDTKQLKNNESSSKRGRVLAFSYLLLANTK